MRRMNLQQLRYVRETIRRGLNLTAAAHALHTSQPGISKAIRELEDELGVTIFVRHGKRLTSLTEEGRQVAVIVDRLLTEADNLKRTSKDWQDANEGELLIAATHTQARYSLPNAIARLRRDYPNVTVRMHQGSPTQIAAMLRQGVVNLGMATEAIGTYPDFESEELFTWHHAALALPDHPLARSKKVSLADLSEHDIVTYDAEFAGRNKIDAAFRAAGLLPRIVIEATDADIIKTYVRLGMGVGLVAELAVDEKGEEGLARLPIGRPFGSNTTRIAYRKGYLLRRYERAMVEMLRR